MPALRPAARSGGARLPAAERPPLLSDESAVRLLEAGEIEVVGRLVDASNATLFCEISDGATTANCVYKPVQGERPLWDFPDGTLAYREVAAYAVSEATGWRIVPPTVLRDGPFGVGMVQLWIEVDEGVDLVELVRADDPRLRRMALFDAIVNNADRKGGHLLPTPDGHLYGVDHGVCFAVEPKLRTLLWGWRGMPIEPDEIAVLESLRDDAALAGRLGALLHASEVEATRARIAELLRSRRFPHPDPDWPAIPWPPF